MSEAKPFSKDAQLARGERRYRRKVASPKQWQAIIAAKREPYCRVCDADASVYHGHHVVSREDHGDDVPDNIVFVCQECHDRITRRERLACRVFVRFLTDAEYAYMIERGGEDYPERAYGVTYER